MSHPNALAPTVRRAPPYYPLEWNFDLHEWTASPKNMIPNVGHASPRGNF